MSRRAIILASVLLIGALPLILACTAGIAVSTGPRWACPSPTPLPWGTSGPVKETIRHTRPISEGGDYEEYVYFAEWEQEYADVGGPPFPSPTPYALVGSSYVFGQRVAIGPLHALVTAEAGALLNAQQQLYRIAISWVNQASAPLAIDYQQQLRLRAVTTPGGALLSDRRWGVTAAALAAADGTALPTSIPPGASAVVVPIIAPPGTPETVELDVVVAPDQVPPLPTATTLAGTPTAMPTRTPTPQTGNPDLRATADAILSVQWSAAAWLPPGAAPCADPGALTDWSNADAVAWGVEEPLAVAAPPGAARVVQIALNQVGKPYVWGAKGPAAFDCSGLMTWAYGQIGIRIPHGTAGQWPGLPAIDRSAIQPGDLIYFAIGGGNVDHVGMLVGDLNGDGRWDMVHAASPALGVRVDYGVFESAYYQPKIVGLRTAR
jgi:cell wall-associated NlpC family hydrolase